MTALCIITQDLASFLKYFQRKQKGNFSKKYMISNAASFKSVKLLLSYGKFVTSHS